MIERDFLEIVQGQIPSNAERLKKALDNPKVIAGFETADPDDLTGATKYIDFLGFVANEHLLFPEEVEEVADRLSVRRVFIKND
ncbi:MAG: hypothetical protein Q7R60_01615 [bacterium]|nr:hypothetical protein [bacterium]